MRLFWVFILSALVASTAIADELVVKRISTNEIVYRSSPVFSPGKGISNASKIHQIPENDLEEVILTDAEIDAWVADRVDDLRLTKMIKDRYWDLAIDDLDKDHDVTSADKVKLNKKKKKKK